MPTRVLPSSVLCLAAAWLAGCSPAADTAADTEPVQLAFTADGRPIVHPNDNRAIGGSWRGDTLVVTLSAIVAAWHPDERADSLLTVQAFAGRDRVPSVPGPLVRVPVGTTVEYHITNAVPDSLLVVHGLRGEGQDPDTVQVASGSTRVVHATRRTPGTWHYRGTTTGDRLGRSELRDGTLTGALIVDAAGTTPRADERIFVLSTVDIVPDSSRPEPREDVFDLAINGRSWPNSEPLEYTVGDSVYWRVVNATGTGHPMHLHGFHFTVLAKSDGVTDTLFAPAARYDVVTEWLDPGATMQLAWTPTRPGQWLFHCHIIPHITPFPNRPDSVRLAQMHDDHDGAGARDHMRDGMAGLVLGITVRDPDDNNAQRAAGGRPPFDPAVATRLRLFAQESPSLAIPGDDTTHRRSYVLASDADPAPDSFGVAAPILLLERGKPTAISVHNRLTEPTSVHWHGMELESYYDGVAGWSGADTRRAPLVQPGDSFVAFMRPPRAGTFMYHPHMDEEDQLSAGLFGPMLVLEPGEVFDPAVDHVFMMGLEPVDGARGLTVNGRRKFAPLTLDAEREHRLRFLNMQLAPSVRISLVAGKDTLTWLARALDGADLPPARRVSRRAAMWLGVGETIDFTWRPPRPGRYTISMRSDGERTPVEVPLVVP